MENTKMTNRKALTFVLENVEGLPEDVAEKLENMIAALDKKSANKSTKPTANQIANESIKAQILDYMKPNTLYQIKEITKALGISTTQKCASLVRQMVLDGRVVRTVDKKIAYFSLAED